jgi:hypothetical protein
VREQAHQLGEPVDGPEQGKRWEMPTQILMVFVGCIIIYSCLFAIGNLLYGDLYQGLLLLAVALAGTVFLFKSFGRLRAQ